MAVNEKGQRDPNAQQAETTRQAGSGQMEGRMQEGQGARIPGAQAPGAGGQGAPLQPGTGQAGAMPDRQGQAAGQAGGMSGGTGAMATGRARGMRPFGAFDEPGMWSSGWENPFAMMRALSRDMDRMFDQMWQSGFGFSRGGEQREWMPRVDVCEREGQLVVRADLPGIDKKDVHVELRGDGVTIQGERRDERTEGEGGFQRVERHYGSFYRHVPLPEGLDLENARARMENGVLEVSIPNPRRGRSRRLAIEPGEGGATVDGESQASTPGGAERRPGGR